MNNEQLHAGDNQKEALSDYDGVQKWAKKELLVALGEAQLGRNTWDNAVWRVVNRAYMEGMKRQREMNTEREFDNAK